MECGKNNSSVRDMIQLKKLKLMLAFSMPALFTLGATGNSKH
jgi:hypothetical protein